MLRRMATALATLMSLPAVTLAAHSSPVDRLTRLEHALGPGAPRIFIKRDDLLTFAQGGNKVRKLQLIAAEILEQRADVVITCGAVQSNHARVTAAVGAIHQWRVLLVLSGQPPDVPTGNLRRDLRYGAEVRFVAQSQDRPAAMEIAAGEATQAGHRPYVIPVGASTPLGAMGMARAVAELSAVGLKPDAVFHASSSAGTQAGLVAGCSLFGLKAQVIGISADEPAAVLVTAVDGLIERMAARLGGRADTLRGGNPLVVDDTQVGHGYGAPTDAATEAMTLLARTEGISLDPVYTAKAFAGLLAQVREGRFGPEQTVLFWHTGGLCE